MVRMRHWFCGVLLSLLLFWGVCGCRRENPETTSVRHSSSAVALPAPDEPTDVPTADAVEDLPQPAMVLIPAGEFTMGSDNPEAPDNQRPARQLFLDDFYIDTHEVTNAQYAEFVMAGGYEERKYWSDEGWNYVRTSGIGLPMLMEFGYVMAVQRVFNAPNQPVVGVSWYEADAYCRWAGKRLPTEAEWEKAARGTDGRRYPWGNEMDFSRVLYFPGNGITTLPVGSYPSGASPYGVLDMAGNVWEWCADWYRPHYQVNSTETPGAGRVCRGGGWDSLRDQLQCAYRYHEKPAYVRHNLGFRCVSSTQPSEATIK